MDIEIIYLNNILNILFIFVKATTKLQAENYPIIYYIIPEIYKIYKKLDEIKNNNNISLFFISLNIINKKVTF
jgi:hypothetical protein